MKIHHYVTFSMLLISSLNAQNNSYDITFKGIKLGEISTLATLNERYLDAKVTNFIAKLLLRKKHFVFYEDQKPKIEDAKYRKDKNKILFVLYEAIVHRPTSKIYNLKNNKKITLSCKNRFCNYDFIKNGKLKGKGVIEFDNKNRFYTLKEEISDVTIIKSK